MEMCPLVDIENCYVRFCNCDTLLSPQSLMQQISHISSSPSFAALHDDSLMGTSAPSMGRITGSASIETLVRVGIEKENGLGPESKMVVLHDFTPCVDDELEVKRGQVSDME